MLSLVWKIVFTKAVLFCTTAVVIATKDRFQTIPGFLNHLQIGAEVLVKTCLKLWDCGFQVCAAQQGRFVHLKGLGEKHTNTY